MPKRKFCDYDEFIEATARRFDRRWACEHGHLAALYDAVLCVLARDADERLHFGDVLGPRDLIHVPEWLAECVTKHAGIILRRDSGRMMRPALTSALDEIEAVVKTARRGRGRHAHWARQYKADTIDWWRFAFVWECRLAGALGLDRRPSGWTSGRDGEEDVFEHVARASGSSPYGGAPDTIRNAYERVTRTVATGDTWRYYPSRNVKFRGQSGSLDYLRAYQ